ncbi:MAG: hypothetical protein MUD01_20660, partial [Chloroflexaceae bacterium]|nr:hypothetical protein [Chloroflexaceae bacterium]
MKPDTVLSSAELETKLRQALPAALHQHVPALVQALLQATDSASGPEAASPFSRISFAFTAEDAEFLMVLRVLGGDTPSLPAPRQCPRVNGDGGGTGD